MSSKTNISALNGALDRAPDTAPETTSEPHGDFPEVLTDLPLVGMPLIRDEVTRLPDKPGVYRMIGQRLPGREAEILYVGKAKRLKRRVVSYTRPTGHSTRILRMINLTHAMEFIVTETETEALLLEASLIKKLKPRFNILLRDDKSFPYILLTTDHEAPQLRKHRGARKIRGHYFGPFASAMSVNQTIDILQKAFLLRNCSDSVYAARTRPCLQHQIKRCAAPCVGLISSSEYESLVADARAFLIGRSRDIQNRLVHEMEEAAEAMQFEKAAEIRDRIKALTYIQQNQDITPGTVINADVFAIYSAGGQACVQSFFFRAGQNWGNHAYFPRHGREDPEAVILSAFLAQFYAGREPPPVILLSHQLEERMLIEAALSLKIDRKVRLLTPQRGEKRELIDHVLMNANEALVRRLSQTASQRKTLRQMQNMLGLESPITRIEVYDNSHISGTNAVGGMIVAGEDGFVKGQYRKFNIKSDHLAPGDDTGMMREVLTRRFSRLAKEIAPGAEGWPDLVVIDGGLGQLSAAREAIEGCGIGIGRHAAEGEVMLMSIAKARRKDARGAKHADRSAAAVDEQFFVPGRDRFQLPAGSPVLYFLQQLRDESHRYAIGTHRARRKAQTSKNPLDQIDGIGSKRKKALLHHFGSAKSVARAKRTDLEAVEGISAAMAEKIYDFFQAE